MYSAIFRMSLQSRHKYNMVATEPPRIHRNHGLKNVRSSSTKNASKANKPSDRVKHRAPWTRGLTVRFKNFSYSKSRSAPKAPVSCKKTLVSGVCCSKTRLCNEILSCRRMRKAADSSSNHLRTLSVQNCQTECDCRIQAKDG